MSKTKKLVLIVLGIWLLSPIVVGPFVYLFSDKDEAGSKQGKARKEVVKPDSYDDLFSAEHSMAQAPQFTTDKNLSLCISKQGVAQLDNRNEGYADYYTYEPQGDQVLLKGDCRFTKKGSGKRQLSPAIPKDMVLEAVKDTSKVFFTATTADGKQSYRLMKRSDSDWLRRNDHIYLTYKRFLNEDPKQLWIATGDDASAYLKRTDDYLTYVLFQPGDLVLATQDPQNEEELTIAYPGEKTLYLQRKQVKPVGSRQQLVALLQKDMSCLDHQQKLGVKFADLEHRYEVRGYFNGWKAGKLAANGFPVFMIWLLVLLLAHTYDIFSNLTLMKWSAALFVLFELWYFSTLGPDAFWTFNEGNAALILGSIVVFLGVVIIEGMFILTVLDELKLANGVDNTVDGWFEHVPEVISVVAAIWVVTKMATSGWSYTVIIPIFYLILMLGNLPSTIDYCRHSNRSYRMFWFIFFCKPAIYVIMAILVAIYFVAVFMKFAKRFSNDVPKESEWLTSYTNSSGDTVKIYKTPDGTIRDDSGNTYTENINSYHCNWTGEDIDKH